MVAPNLEVSTAEGGLDDTVEELIEVARENEARGAAAEVRVRAVGNWLVGVGMVGWVG